jgi:hypothetical protein
MPRSIEKNKNLQTHLLINPAYANQVTENNLNALEFGIQLDSASYDTVCDDIYTLVITNQLCKTEQNEIKIDDAQKAFKNAHLLLCFGNRHNNSIRNIDGFALLTTRRLSIYVNLICTKKGFGKMLIDAISCICLQMSKRQIELDSVESAIGFYETVGFTPISVDGKQMVKRLVDIEEKYCDFPTSRQRGGGQAHIQDETAQNKKTTKDDA